MEPFDFFAAVFELGDHAVEVATEVADFVVASREGDRYIQVAVSHGSDFFLQLDQGTLNDICHHQQKNDTNRDGPGASNYQDHVPLRILPGDCRQREQQQPIE